MHLIESESECSKTKIVGDLTKIWFTEILLFAFACCSERARSKWVYVCLFERERREKVSIQRGERENWKRRERERERDRETERWKIWKALQVCFKGATSLCVQASLVSHFSFRKKVPRNKIVANKVRFFSYEQFWRYFVMNYAKLCINQQHHPA